MAESKEPTEKSAATTDQTTEVHEQEISAASVDAPAGLPSEAASGSSRDERDEELAQLKRRIQEQDQRWEHTTKLLSDIAQRHTQESAKPAAAKTYATPIIITMAAVALIGVGGFLYSRSGKPEPSAPMVASHDTAPAAASAPPAIATTQHNDVPAQSQPPAAQVVPPAPSASQQEASKSSISNQASPPVPQTEIESAPEASQPPPRPKVVEATLNDDLSKRLSEYLHTHKLPYVDALVFATTGGTPKSVELSGQVRTFIGKEHAATHAKEFFPSHILIKNRIEISPALAAKASAPNPELPGGPTASNNSCQSTCQSDQSSCDIKCKTDAAGNAPSLKEGLKHLFGQLTRAGADLKQCSEKCKEDLNQCVAGCGQSAGSEAQSAPEAPPPSNNAPPSAEGPDSPPE